MIATLWRRLAEVTHLEFVAQSAHASGWNGAGSGSVRVEHRSDSQVLYHEKGAWRTANGDALSFTNIFRWTLRGERIGLEHLRFGADAPVYLFEIEAMPEIAGGTPVPHFRSAQPHVCSADLYAADLNLEGARILMGWSVTGPHKQERIDYTYTSGD